VKVAAGAAAPVITTQPKAFNWSRLKDANADPNSTVTSFAPALTVVATGSNLKYQWYKKAVNPNAADTIVGTNSATYTPTITALGMTSYYVVVSNEFGSVTSKMIDVAAGCGAKTATGGWLKFMCYNLGVPTAAYAKDPFTFTASDTTILGKFYQWGSNVAVSYKDSTGHIKTTAYPYDWKVPGGYTAAAPETKDNHQDDYLWKNHNDGTHDPCPAGWHVPSQSAFGAIFKGTADADAYANATANTWSPGGTWSWTGLSSFGNGGYAVQPDGTTTTLFLPAAGYRDSSTGTLGNVGLGGLYWSSTTAGAGAYTLVIYSSRVYPSYIYNRGYGFSVRCVSEY
jgi:uncharacterized protein (TIGR02145 family)